ncbi:unnamed protein product [Urochloa humidicola]
MVGGAFSLFPIPSVADLRPSDCASEHPNAAPAFSSTVCSRSLASLVVVRFVPLLGSAGACAFSALFFVRQIPVLRITDWSCAVALATTARSCAAFLLDVGEALVCLCLLTSTKFVDIVSVGLLIVTFCSSWNIRLCSSEGVTFLLPPSSNFLIDLWIILNLALNSLLSALPAASDS